MSNFPNEIKFADAWQIGYDRGYDDSTATSQIEPDPDFNSEELQYYFEGYQAGADDYYKDHGDDLADYDDSMDGDFDSGMASAGYGTDESYGYYGDE